MAEMHLDKLESKEIWVDINEATELTGYNRESMRSLAQRMSLKSDEEREINIRKRSNRWELWLPDLLFYINEPGHGAKQKRKESS